VDKRNISRRILLLCIRRTIRGIAIFSGGPTARLIGMAEKTEKPRSAEKAPSRSPVNRIRTLATAALTADEKVDQLEALLETMTSALSGMESTMRYTEETLRQFNESLIEIDKLSPRLIGMVDRMEAMVTRVERIIDVAELGTGPFTAAESAVRGVVGAISSKLIPKTPDKTTPKKASAPKKKSPRKSE
jgi:hypothetical protein